MGADFSDASIIQSDSPTTVVCHGAPFPAAGANCRTGCKTKDHASYHECLRDAGVRTYLASPSRGLDGTAQKNWDKELEGYRQARRQGIQPDGTTKAKVEAAVRRSDAAGAAYGRDFSPANPMGN